MGMVIQDDSKETLLFYEEVLGLIRARAGYWRRKYRGCQEDKAWYLLTNVGNLRQSIDTFKCRSGIEAMFKDCKTVGYNEREKPR